MLTAAHLAEMLTTLARVENLAVNPTPQEIGHLRAMAGWHRIVINVYALNHIQVPVDLTAAPPQQEAAQ